MEKIWRDLQYAWRQAGRSPALTLAVVAALAIGIGLNGAVFSLLNGFWFQAPVQKDPASFVQVIPKYSGWFDTEDQFNGFTVKDYEAMRTRAKSLESVAAINGTGGVKVDDGAISTGMLLATCNVFEVYGWGPPRLGRLLQSQDCATPGEAPVAVISEDLWRSQFAANPKIIGRIVRLNQHPFTIVGVVNTPAPVWMKADIWVPYTMEAEFYNGYDGFSEANWPWLTTAGRLKPGYSRAEARSELQQIEGEQDRLIPGRRTEVTVTNGSLFENPSMRKFGMLIIPLIMGPMLLILLVACTNVVMLLLARAASRRGEIAIRLTLGAGRGNLLRMLGAEGLVISAAAGAISIWLAYKLPGVFWTLLLRQSAYTVLKPDWVVFAYLAGVTLVAGCIAGLMPARESLKVDLVTALKGQESAGTSRSRLRSALVIAQIAMSFVLVAAGVMFARVQRGILAIDPGFDTRQVMSVPLIVTMPPYTQQTAANFYREVQERVGEVPGVRAVSYASAAPFSSAAHQEIRTPEQAKGRGIKAVVDDVSTNFFAAMSIPILRGRAFRESDVTPQGKSSVVIVSQAFAGAFWPGQDAVGKAVVTPDETRALVVGVARDTKSEEYGVTDGPRLYVPQGEEALSGLLLVRFEGEARSVAPAIQKAVRGLDATQVVVPQTLRSMMEQRAEQIRPLSETVLLMALIAVLLAISGVYGVVAFSMSQRTREFGIRMALGATRGRILRAVMMAGARQIAIGLALGVVLAMPAAYAWFRLARGSLFGGSSMEAGTYIVAAVLLLGAALAATFLPARRATKVDPAVALRYE